MDTEIRKAGVIWVYDLSSCQDKSYLEKRALLEANNAALGEDGNTWYVDHVIPELFDYLRKK